MRRKGRCLCLSTVVFILVVSFKILEPELRRKTTDGFYDAPWGVNARDTDEIELAKEKVESKEEDGLGDNGEDHVFVPRVGLIKQEVEENVPDPQPDPQVVKQKLIDTYLLMYDVDWSVKLEGSPWQLADSWVTNRQIHPDNATLLGGVLQRLATARILSADVGYKGTQLKLSFTLSGGRRASFKPKWYARDYVVLGRPFEGKDRHNAEVAAYHLQRILGYNRAPVTVGRTVDLLQDVLPVAEERLNKTFFQNGSNTCFYGRCLYCKSKETGVCAERSKMEGALVLWLPESVTFKKWRSPWQRVYDEPPARKARWEVEDGYCDYVRQHSPYDRGPRLMDLMDAVVMDYLIGNADRHHYETFTKSDNDTIVMFDNAKSFGNPDHDEYSILAPLYQCCQIRHNTFQRLQELQNGVLSAVLRHILSRDPIAPVLHEPHYAAMDRRLVAILSEVNKCVAKHGAEYVLIRERYDEQQLS